ncbi:MAG: DMT family transporter [Alphaproteobacteria bacterium]|nr:DMT family transporter [Alphaproteobacteria bacterium]
MKGAEDATAPGTMPVWLAFALLFFCAFCWAGSSIVGRMAAGHVPPMAMSFWRWSAAFLVLLPFGYVALSRQWRVVLHHWRRMTLFAVLGIVGFTAPYYVGLQYTEAVNATLLNAAGPVLILLCSLAIYGIRVTPRQIVGVAVAMAGMFVIVTRGNLESLIAFRLNVGDILVLASHLSWSIYTVILRRAPPGLDPIGFITALVGFSLPIFLALYLWEIASGLGFTASASNLAMIGYAAVFPSAIAYLFWGKGVAVVGANAGGAVQYVVPVIGVLLAIGLLGETFAMFHMVGIALIAIGVYLATRAERSRQR